MAVPTREMPDLELALMRQGLDRLSAVCERCGCCQRTPLIGERVYEYASGVITCELCRTTLQDRPVDSHIIHGPEFGHTMRITDQRVAA